MLAVSIPETGASGNPGAEGGCGRNPGMVPALTGSAGPFLLVGGWLGKMSSLASPEDVSANPQFEFIKYLGHYNLSFFICTRPVI